MFKLRQEHLQAFEAQVVRQFTVRVLTHVKAVFPEECAELGEPGVPALFVLDGAPVKGLSGTLTVLADHGFDDAEAIEWLFMADDSLPGRPIDALREDRGKEVHRRAQAIV